MPCVVHPLEITVSEENEAAAAPAIPAAKTVPLWVERDDGTTRATHFEALSIEDLNQQVPEYELSVLFSSDFTGALYRGRQPKLERDICLKLLPPIAGTEGESYAAAFTHEAHTMASLNHPNIIKVHDFGKTEGGLNYFVMEYVEGSILRRVVNLQQLTLDHIFGWTPQICEALQHAHLQGVVHCDIRPTNILISNEGSVKVANFGLSRVQGQRPEISDSMSNSISATTLNYASPEMRDPAASIDYRTDIYSLGVVLFEMLTGQIPTIDGPPASEIAGVDPRFDRIIAGALEPDREARFQTALDISVRLRAIQNEPQPAATEVRRPKFKFG
ncbi:MAG: serine/threonine protein kinase [Verrucomicrobiales bacterium]|jgi:serine/threonine protein kinase